MQLKIDYISIKIPIIRLCRSRAKQKLLCLAADNVTVGSVVITQNMLDIGLVAKEEDGKPTEIFSRYTCDSWRKRTCNMYGGVQTVKWYDTGIHMSLQDWIDLSMQYDAAGFYEYWGIRLGKLGIRNWVYNK